MNHLKCVLASTVLWAASACGNVTVTQPIGEVPVKLESDEWEGLWKSYGDGKPEFGLIEIVDAENGVLKLSGLWSEEDSMMVTLRRSGEWVFANVLEYESSEAPYYSWGKVERSDDLIVFWMPDVAKFRGLVQAGRLPGNGVALTELQPEHLKLITSGAEGVLFEWDEPLILIRFSKRH